MRELPNDTPMQEIERLYRIDRMLEEAKYAIIEKKFLEDKAERLRQDFEDKTVKEVASGSIKGASRRKKRT
jgi:hypothetical protein